MATITEIREAIKEKIESVPDIGLVYDYQLVPDPDNGGIERMREQFTWPTNGLIRGTHFWRESEENAYYTVGTTGTPTSMSPIMETLVWSIEVWLQVEGTGESEKTLDQLWQDVRAAFLADPRLGGILFSITETPLIGIQVREKSTDNFLGPNCHYLDIGLITKQYLE